MLEELALGTVGHLFGTIHTVEKNLASAMAKSRLMKLMPFRRYEGGEGETERARGTESEILFVFFSGSVHCSFGERNARHMPLLGVFRECTSQNLLAPPSIVVRRCAYNPRRLLAPHKKKNKRESKADRINYGSHAPSARTYEQALRMVLLLEGLRGHVTAMSLAIRQRSD